MDIGLSKKEAAQAAIEIACAILSNPNACTDKDKIDFSSDMESVIAEFIESMANTLSDE